MRTKICEQITHGSARKNDRLEIENRNYSLLRKRLGKQQLDALVEQAKAAKHTTRRKNETRER